MIIRQEVGGEGCVGGISEDRQAGECLDVLRNVGDIGSDCQGLLMVVELEESVCTVPNE